MKSPTRLVSLAACVLSLLLAACDPCAGVACGPCPAPIVLRVTDSAAGGSVPNVTVVSAGGEITSCMESATHTQCMVVAQGPGHFDLTVSAPGYPTATLGVDVSPSAPGGCCNCGVVPVVFDVGL